MDSSFSERSESSFTAINERTKLAGETDDGVRPLVDVRETLPSFSSFGNYARCARFGSIASASERYAMDGKDARFDVRHGFYRAFAKNNRCGSDDFKLGYD